LLVAPRSSAFQRISPDAFNAKYAFATGSSTTPPRGVRVWIARGEARQRLTAETVVLTA
jgi:hypothetical protein